MGSHAARLAEACGPDHAESYWRDGYAIVRGVFDPSEVAAIGDAIDRLHGEGLAHGRSFRHGNLFYRVEAAGNGRPAVRMVQWPSWREPVLDRVRLDLRMAALIEPLIGRRTKQIINQVHWKSPGPSNDFGWHQDSRFREPASAYRNLGRAYVQTGLAVDPHTPASGGMRFVPGSHRRGDLGLPCSGDVLGTAMNDTVLRAAGLSPAAVVDVELEPGDVALWSPFLVHGSGENCSGHRRRLYINGYVRAEDCDRGEWAFRDGRPVPLGREPALVHYEALHERGGPHYV